MGRVHAHQHSAWKNGHSCRYSFLVFLGAAVPSPQSDWCSAHFRSPCRPIRVQTPRLRTLNSSRASPRRRTQPTAPARSTLSVTPCCTAAPRATASKHLPAREIRATAVSPWSTTTATMASCRPLPRTRPATHRARRMRRPPAAPCCTPASTGAPSRLPRRATGSASCRPDRRRIRPSPALSMRPGRCIKRRPTSPRSCRPPGRATIGRATSVASPARTGTPAGRW